MRILLTVDPELAVPPKLYGGIERIVDLLIRGLRSKGHTVELLARADSTAAVDHLYPWPGRRSQPIADIWKNTTTCTHAVREFRPDIIHCFSRLLYLFSSLRSSIPKIMTYEREPTPRSVRWGARLAGESIAFVGCSRYIAQRGRAAGGRWHVIHNAVDVERYRFVPNVPSDAPLVFLSRVERIKGAHTAIAAARAAGRRLIIAGNHGDQGEDKRYWDEEIQPHIGRDGVEYAGPVNDAQKNEFLGKAAAMLVPIEWEEPFGIVFAEALACGTPVISCPRGALPEIIRQGVDGFLGRNMDELVKAIDQVHRIDRRSCRDRAEQSFSSAVLVQQYIGLYEAMLRPVQAPVGEGSVA